MNHNGAQATSIKRFARDPRIAVGGFTPSGFGQAGRQAAGFVASRLARFSRLIGQAPWTGRHLARPPQAAVVFQRWIDNTNHKTTIRLVPNIRLTVLASPTASNSSATPALERQRRRIHPRGLDPRTVYRPPTARLRLAAVRSTAPTSSAPGLSGPQASEQDRQPAAKRSASAPWTVQQRAVQMLEEALPLVLGASPRLSFRLANRQERHAMVNAGPPDGLPTNAYRPAPVAARQLLERPAPVDVTNPSAVQSSNPGFAHADWPATNPMQRPLELGQQEIKRLADQVVQVIDRRIVAHNERMGRA